jgi:fibro-slime domain-containing protein
MTTQENFDQWYRDVPGINVRKDTEVVLTRQQNGAYTYPAVSGQQLFPLDNQGFVAQNLESSLYGHNFGFTSELHTWFLFQGGETLMFAGDDDVWIFVNGRLALDIGGLHPLVTRTIVLDAATGAANCYTGSTTTTPCSVPSIELGIQPGRLYQLSLFHAERAASDSNFTLTLMGFVGTPTVCSKL